MFQFSSALLFGHLLTLPLGVFGLLLPRCGHVSAGGLVLLRAVNRAWPQTVMRGVLEDQAVQLRSDPQGRHLW